MNKFSNSLVTIITVKWFKRKWLKEGTLTLCISKLFLNKLLFKLKHVLLFWLLQRIMCKGKSYPRLSNELIENKSKTIQLFYWILYTWTPEIRPFFDINNVYLYLGIWLRTLFTSTYCLISGVQVYIYNSI